MNNSKNREKSFSSDIKQFAKETNFEELFNKLKQTKVRQKLDNTNEKTNQFNEVTEKNVSTTQSNKRYLNTSGDSTVQIDYSEFNKKKSVNKGFKRTRRESIEQSIKSNSNEIAGSLNESVIIDRMDAQSKSILINDQHSHTGSKVMKLNQNDMKNTNDGRIHLITENSIKPSKQCSGEDDDWIDDESSKLSNPVIQYSKIDSFYELSIPAILMRSLEFRMIREPTELQRIILGSLLHHEHRHNIITCKPYSKKKTTLILTALIRVDISSYRPQVVIIQPSDLLVKLTHQNILDIVKGSKTYVVKLNDDREIPLMISEHIVVGTLDLINLAINKNALKLSELHAIIFDEVESLFEPHGDAIIKRILRKVPINCQRIFSSSCLCDRISNFVYSLSNDVHNLNLLTRADYFRNLIQFKVVSTFDQKYEALMSVIRNSKKQRKIVFVNSQVIAKKLADKLYRASIISILINTSDHYNSGNIKKNFEACDDSVLVVVANDLIGFHLASHYMVINYDTQSIKSLCDYLIRIRSLASSDLDGRPRFVINFMDHEHDLEDILGMNMIELDVFDRHKIETSNETVS